MPYTIPQTASASYPSARRQELTLAAAQPFPHNCHAGGPS